MSFSPFGLSPTTGAPNANSQDPIQMVEMLLLRLDTFPWDAGFRTAVGFAVLPAMSRLWNGKPSGWELVLFLLIVLFLLRLVPAVVRKLMPFSSKVQEIWAERRQLAKRYDSYQWQKVFWIGLGMASYTALSGQFLTSRIVVCSICLLGGVVGWVRWRAIASRLKAVAHQERKSNLVSGC